MKNYYNFYLVALNENPRIINIDKEQLNVEDDKVLTNIAYIDKLTTNYEEGVFRRYLYDKKIIDKIYTPIFIVRSYKLNGKIGIKFYSVLFKKGNTDLIDNLATNILRQRELSISDASYLLNKFERMYFNNEDFHDIADYIINEHDINHLLNYKQNYTDKKKNPIKYVLLRDVVSVFYEYEKNKSFEKYLMDVYDRDKYKTKIIKILPESIKVRKTDIDKVKYVTDEEIKRIKNEKWDNVVAQEEFKNERISLKTVSLLTLEDRLRAGLITDNEYAMSREKFETKFRK